LFGIRFILEKRRHLERRIFDRERAQAEIERVCPQHLQRLRTLSCLETDFQLRMIGLELP
jgi:hypothetical protein